MISTAVIMSALELGCIYALVALALFLSFRVLNIADMTTDGSFTLGCAVSATVAVAGHPILALPAAMIAGAAHYLLYQKSVHLDLFCPRQILFSFLWNDYLTDLQPGLQNK